MTGIKETTEVLLLLKVLPAVYAEAAKDGKIGNLADLRLLPKLMGPVRDAVKDVAKVKEELADLDRAELETLTAQLIDGLMGLVALAA